MKITKVELIPVSSPLKRPFVMRKETLTTIESVVIKMYTDEGIIGIGDTGNVSSWYHGETQESIMAIIARTIAPHILLGEDPRKVEKIMDMTDFLVKDNYQAKMLVDFALHDIKGKSFGVPCYEFFGGKSVDKLKLGYVMSAFKAEEAVPMAKKALQEGFGLLKLKMGGDFEEDVEMVAAVREAVGPKVEMFIDVNGHWHYREALDKIRRLEPYHLSLVEQPLPPWDIEGMARLRTMVETPIYADESARDLHDLHRIFRLNAADGLMIKIAKAGGLLKSQRWITLAQSAGMVVMSGCMGGSGVETAAYSHILCASAWASRFYQENTGPLHMHDVMNTVDKPITDDIAVNVPRIENGFLYPTDTPGLGAELNEDRINEIITIGMKPVIVNA